MEQFAYTSSQNIIKRMKNNLNNKTEIKLLLGLDIIWSLYRKRFGRLHNYPNELCPMNFTINSISFVDKNTINDFNSKVKYDNLDNQLNIDKEQDKELKSFIDLIINQLNTMFDYEIANLVNRNTKNIEVYKNKKIRYKDVYRSIGTLNERTLLTDGYSGLG